MELARKIEVGDTIYIEQAWEDEAGQEHDEYAEVSAIDKDGFMKLNFDREETTDFLSGADFNVKDYKPED